MCFIKLIIAILRTPISTRNLLYILCSLYNQLEEVQQRKQIEERQLAYKQNRERRKEFEKVIVLNCLFSRVDFLKAGQAGVM